MEIGAVIGLIIAAIVVVLIVVQIQIRRQHHFESPLAPDIALKNVTDAFDREATLNSAGEVEVPLNGGVLSIAADSTGSGSSMHVWLSRYNFIGANGFQVLDYKRRVSKIRRVVNAA